MNLHIEHLLKKHNQRIDIMGSILKPGCIAGQNQQAILAL
jgi:hypothetical protein